MTDARASGFAKSQRSRSGIVITAYRVLFCNNYVSMWVIPTTSYYFIIELFMTDRRLIEDFIPIKEISVEAAREKSIRKGHISTLHLWWAH